MSQMFRAYYVFYDTENSIYKRGQRVILNMDHVVLVTEYNTFNAKKEDGLGKIFQVDTINNHSGYSLKVTSSYLEAQMEFTV